MVEQCLQDDIVYLFHKIQKCGRHVYLDLLENR